MRYRVFLCSISILDTVMPAMARQLVTQIILVSVSCCLSLPGISDTVAHALKIGMEMTCLVMEFCIVNEENTK
jgi:hypothetical protein